MSIKAMTWARDQVVGGGSRKLVLLLLADYADDDGQCWPGIETVAEKAEVSEKTVRRHLQQLAEDGFLERHRRRRSDGTMGVYEYQLRMGSATAANGAREDPTSAQDTPPGKLTGGDPESEEDGETTPQTPHETGPPEEVSTAQDAPAGKLTGGQKGEMPPDSGTKAPSHRSSCPSPPDNESRTTGHGDRAEPSGEQPVGPPPSPAEGGKKLEAFLADHPEALEALRDLDGWSPRVEETFLARFVSGPTGELLLKGVPEEYQPAVIAECIWQYLEPRKGEPPARWNGARFQGWLRSAGQQARRNVSVAVAAKPVGDPDEHGAQRLEGGGLLMPDGRRLTPAQARALERVRSRMESRRSA